MQENRTKTQLLLQRYKVEVWPKEAGKRLTAGNEVQNQNRMACTDKALILNSQTLVKLASFCPELK
jgi:hypothetical protein